MKRVIPILLSLLSGIAIFSNCSKYGTLYCGFELKGKVKASDNNPIENIQIIIKKSNAEYSDTIYTNSSGDYKIIIEKNETITEYSVIANDIDDQNGGKFNSQIKILTVGNSDCKMDEYTLKELNFNLKTE